MLALNDSYGIDMSLNKESNPNQDLGLFSVPQKQKSFLWLPFKKCLDHIKILRIFKSTENTQNKPTDAGSVENLPYYFEE